MTAASYRRGSRVLMRDADRAMPEIHAREDARATKDEAARLRARIAELERDLRRARRCLAAERLAREARVAEARADRSAADFAIATLCKRAFPSDGGAS